MSQISPDIILLMMIICFIGWLLSLKEPKKSNPKLCTRCNSGLPVLTNSTNSCCVKCENKY